MMRVVFVDDEPNILSGLRRILRPMRDQWQMTFVTSGREALEIVEKEPCDVVVSDMKMPGMDGAEFLAQVRERHPESIRIALSGETDNHMIYRCVQHAHQYIAKPCDAESLVATVRRAHALRDMMTDTGLKALVAGLTSLPSLPDQYRQIMAEMQEEEPSLQRVAGIIETDVAMTAKILQLVNSAFFGLVRQVSSPSEAAMYLGLDVIRSLVLTTGVFSQFDDPPVSRSTLENIWNRSMQTANLARDIAAAHSAERIVADYAYMGGMLMDVGRLVLIANMPDAVREIDARIQDEGLSRHEAEKAVIGHAHSEVGAYLCGLWGLPNPVVECVAFRHMPTACAAEAFPPVAALYLARAIIDGNGLPEELDQEYLSRPSIAADVERCIEIWHRQQAER